VAWLKAPVWHAETHEMRKESVPITEDLRIVEMKIKTLKREYEQYFLGARPREPSMVRAEVQKVMVRFANMSIRNTAERFKFNTLNAQFMTYKRTWDDTLRKIEAGTYKRHVFKANLHERERGGAASGPAAASRNSAAGENIFDKYLKAAESCGQSTAGLTPEKLKAVISKQEAAIKKKLGVEKVKFRVEVQDGKVKLKATAVRAA
jgi:hypothetical protein